MPSLFTKIIEGEVPARFVWRDPVCVTFLTIAPIRPGHVLVVPRREVDHWLDLETSELEHLMRTSQTVGRALQRAFQPITVGMMIAGLEVPHVHIHLVPIEALGDLNFEQSDPNPDPQQLDAAAKAIRAALPPGG